MDTKRTEWTDAAGWKRSEVHDKDGKLIETCWQSPDGSYDEKRLHVAVPMEALSLALYGSLKGDG